jgi:hypothetical protein
MLKRNLILIAAALLLALAACRFLPSAAPAVTPTLAPAAQAAATATPTATVAASSSPTATASPSPAPSATPYEVGPASYPDDVNPLTGLPADDPAVLDRRPLIVKVSNQSDEVRPQSGLSFADHVWMYQTEGWHQTRFAAVFYGQTPEHVGSVRSARLIDSEHLVPMYGALLAISGASRDMYRQLMSADWWDRVFREDPEHVLQQRLPDIPREGTAYTHSLFAVPAAIWAAAEERGLGGPPSLAGLYFSSEAPPGGEDAAELVVDYADYGPRQMWRYDADQGAYLSWTEMQLEEGGEATPDLDYLTSEQLAFPNVVVLWAEHYYAEDFTETPGAGVRLLGEGDALALRDGQSYELTWRRDDPEAMIELIMADGEPYPLKPGSTWFHTAAIEEEHYPPEVTTSASRSD